MVDTISGLFSRASASPSSAAVKPGASVSMALVGRLIPVPCRTTGGSVKFR